MRGTSKSPIANPVKKAEKSRRAEAAEALLSINFVVDVGEGQNGEVSLLQQTFFTFGAFAISLPFSLLSCESSPIWLPFLKHGLPLFERRPFPRCLWRLLLRLALVPILSGLSLSPLKKYLQKFFL